MGEPSRVGFGKIPEAPADGYVIETGAAAGMRSHLTAEHLAPLRCRICGARAGMGTDGRLYMEHEWLRHSELANGGMASALQQPVRREQPESERWWDA